MEIQNRYLISKTGNENGCSQVEKKNLLWTGLALSLFACRVVFNCIDMVLP